MEPLPKRTPDQALREAAQQYPPEPYMIVDYDLSEWSQAEMERLFKEAQGETGGAV